MDKLSFCDEIMRGTGYMSTSMAFFDCREFDMMGGRRAIVSIRDKPFEMRAFSIYTRAGQP